jgi:hypothetical protein
MENVDQFVERISTLRLENCFNPYSDCCSVYDVFDAPQIRKENLRQILRALSFFPRIDVWIGRDLGYKGGRRTGLALTDECCLHLYAMHLKIERLKKSTNGPAVKERTAANVYSILTHVTVPVLTWNVFPLHPHEAGKPFSNRQHTRGEAEIGLNFLSELCSLFPVRRLVAIGGDAAASAQRLDLESIHVRHPSYGGQTIFLEQMREIYELKAMKNVQIDLFH